MRAVAGLAMAAYPLLVWLGMGGRTPRMLALLLLLVFAPVAVLRLRRTRAAQLRGLAAIPLVTVASLGLATWLDDAGFLLGVPVAVNALFLLAFGTSLRPGSIPMITRFARLEVGVTTPAQERWCRAWTIAWCAFFVANGATAALLAWLAPLSWWAFYTGMLSYALVGALIGLERLLRRRRFPATPRAGMEAAP